MLKLAEDIGYLTRHGNVTCPVFVIPFQTHARVHFSLPISCELIADQEGVSKVICMLISHILDCKKSTMREKAIGLVLCNHIPGMWCDG
jgi:hypothetical protein